MKVFNEYECQNLVRKNVGKENFCLFSYFRDRQLYPAACYTEKAILN